jgi:integrase
MYITEKIPLAKYIPARMHEGKTWFISFYVIDPGINKLKRIRTKINRVPTVKLRRQWGRQLVNEINIKLANGWNPILEAESSKSYHKLIDVMNTFIATKGKELRYDSMKSYKSFIKILKEYILRNPKNKDLYVISFDKSMAINFMQDCYLKNNISERAYNNYISFYKLFFNWCMQYNYCKGNPFESFAKKKEKQKTRIMIDQFTRDNLKEYLIKNDYEYFVVCMLAYYVLLRPKEIAYLKIKYIDLEKQIIFMPGTISKSCKDNRPTIPDVVCNYLKKMELEKFNKEHYLFSKNFKPGPDLIELRAIGRKWIELRKILKIPAEMQFYSLRDTGITQMLRSGVSADQVRDQAGHSSLEITNIYTKHLNNNANEDIKKKCLEF